MKSEQPLLYVSVCYGLIVQKKKKKEIIHSQSFTVKQPKHDKRRGQQSCISMEQGMNNCVKCK